MKLSPSLAAKVRVWRRAMRAGLTLDEIVARCEETIKDEPWRESEKVVALVDLYAARDYIQAHPRKDGAMRTEREKQWEQWQRWLDECRAMPVSDLRRHASVSKNNRHRCAECFCCAALTVLEDG